MFKTCFAIGVIHLLVLSISTYIASIRIESILGSGWICALTGLAVAIVGWRAKSRGLAIVGVLPAVLGIALVLFENSSWGLGPDRAAVPFSILFIVHNVVSTILILAILNPMATRSPVWKFRLSLGTLFVFTSAFGVFFAIARLLLATKHNWIMATSLGLLGLTFVGMIVTIYSVVLVRPSPREVAED